jgi:hypothetical protein
MFERESPETARAVPPDGRAKGILSPQAGRTQTNTQKQRAGRKLTPLMLNDREAGASGLIR